MHGQDKLRIPLPDGENPSCLQTTLASGAPHKSSHTVPQTLPLQNSTRPSLTLAPPTSLKSPFEHAMKELHNFHKARRQGEDIRTLSSGRTDHSSIFIMSTVVNSKPSAGAVKQSRFPSNAAHIIKEDESSGETLTICR